MAHNRINFALVAAAAALAVTLGTVPGNAGEKTALDKVRADFVKRFPQIDPASVDYGPVDGLLEIRQGTLIAYLTEDGRYLFQGDLIDLVTDTNLTEKAASTERSSMMSAVERQNTINFGPEKPAYSVSIFTDVDCTFCRKLHREIDDYKAAGIEVRYLLYPRGGPGSETWSKSEDVVCATDRNNALTRAKNDQTVKAEQCDAAALVAEHYRLGQEVGLRGTPAIVLDDGELISGYVPAAELARRLQVASSGVVD